MKKHLLTLLFFLFSSIALWAVSDFREGYIVKNTNDTLFGFIHYQGMFQESRVCLFRKQPDSKTTAYFPRDLKAFRFTDSRYYLSREFQNGTQKDTVFMEFLINGKVSLFSFYDKGVVRYFADTESKKLMELQDEDKVFYLNGKNYMKSTKRYIGVLKYIFSESPSIINRVEKINLTQKSLVQVAHDYHLEVCDGEACIIYEKSLKPKNNRFQIGLLSHVTTYRLYHLEDFGLTYWNWQQCNYNTAFFPAFGLFARKNLPSIHDKLFIQYEGAFAQDNLIGKELAYSMLNINRYNCIYYQRNFLQNALLLKREYDVGKIACSWHAGAFLDYTFRSDYKHMYEKWDESQHVIGTPALVDTDNPFAKTELGLLIGTGLTLPITEKWFGFVDFRYQNGLGLKQFSPDYTNKSYLSLSFGLAFGK